MNTDQQFAAAEEAGKNNESFEALILRLVPPEHLNAQNWMFWFDTIYYRWQRGAKQEVDIAIRDQMAMQLVPPHLQEELNLIIQRQQWEAKKFAKELKESGLSPLEVLDVSGEVARAIAIDEATGKAIANHPSPLSIPMQLCQLMLDFYSPGDLKSRTNLVKPLKIAAEVVLKSPQSPPLELQHFVIGQLTSFLDAVARGEAKGIVFPNWRQSVNKFAYFFVFDVFVGKYSSDLAKLSGREFDMILDAVVALVRLELDKRRK